MRDNYQFILLVRASNFRSVSMTVSITEDLGHWCEWRTCHSSVAFLMHRENFIEKFSVALGFLSSVIAFCGLLFHNWGRFLMCSGRTSMHLTLLEATNRWTRIWQQHARFLGW
jgi:hypothetical protein